MTIKRDRNGGFGEMTLRGGSVCSGIGAPELEHKLREMKGK